MKLISYVLLAAAFFFCNCRSYILVPENIESVPVQEFNRKKITFLGFLFYWPPMAVLPAPMTKAVCSLYNNKRRKFNCTKKGGFCEQMKEQWEKHGRYEKFFSISKNYDTCAISASAFNRYPPYFKEFSKYEKTDESYIDLQSSKFSEFAKLYFEDYGVQGVDDFSRIFKLNDSGEVVNLKSHSDYYIIGKFEPVERSLTLKGFFTYYLTLLPYTLTFGMIPSVEHNRITPSYYIYDKNFNQVASYHYSSEYWLIDTLWELDPKYPWVFGGWSISMNDFSNFHPSMIEFKKELAKFCEVNKC